MGYCYARPGGLCCDHCGMAGGVRKRTCIHVVTDANGHRLPYCPAPALCPTCWKMLGGNAVHEACRPGAERMQAKENAKRALLESGEFLRSGASSRPGDMVEVTFRNRAGEERRALMPSDTYHTIEYGQTATLASYGLDWGQYGL